MKIQKIATILLLSLLIFCSCGKSNNSKQTTLEETSTSVETIATTTLETTTQQETTQQETTTSQELELVWIEEPQYKYDNVEPLTDNFPQGSVMAEKCGDYTTRVFVHKDNKVGLADYKGNLYIDLNEELHLDPRAGIVTYSHKYDVNGNTVGSAAGSEGGSYLWNEGTRSIYGGVYGLEEISTTFDYMVSMKEINMSVSEIETFVEGSGLPESVFTGYHRLINRDGSLIIDEKFDGIKQDVCGQIVGDYAVVKQNCKWGYIKSDGTWLIECKYDDAYPFINGIAAVKENGKAGFINEDGSIAYEFIFEETRSIFEGKAWVKYEGKWGVLSLNGEVEDDYDFSGVEEKAIDAYTSVIYDELAENENWFFGIASISMCDITGDGIDELYVVYESGRGGQGYIYVYSDSGIAEIGSPNNAAGGHYFETYRNKETGEIRIIKVWMGNGIQDYEVNDFNNKGELINVTNYFNLDYNESVNEGFDRMEWNASHYRELNKTANECNKDNIKQWILHMINS